jgi:type VI secretion system protein ImpH
LEKILSDYFELPIEGKMFKGQWQRLEPDQWTSIGKSGQNQRLGENLVLGTRFWDQTSKFKLCIGPMTLKEMKTFFPGERAFEPLCEITRLFTRAEINFDIQLTIKAAEVPSLRLGSKQGARLGWTSWLKTKEFSKNDSQVVISPN